MIRKYFAETQMYHDFTILNGMYLQWIFCSLKRLMLKRDQKEWLNSGEVIEIIFLKRKVICEQLKLIVRNNNWDKFGLC